MVQDDRLYTLNSLVEELALLERHVRDGSWKVCTCIPEKHLPLIAGFTSEGYQFAQTPEEKRLMEVIRDFSRAVKMRMNQEPISVTEGGMDALSEWARLVRHKIEETYLTKDFKPCPVCQLTEKARVEQKLEGMKEESSRSLQEEPKYEIEVFEPLDLEKISPLFAVLGIISVPVALWFISNSVQPSLSR